MDTAKQSYWKREYDIRSKVGADTSFIKRQYHKARRINDKNVIIDEIEHFLVDSMIVDTRKHHYLRYLNL